MVAGQAQDSYPVPAVFVRDMQLGVSELIGVDPLSPVGAELGNSSGVSMRADGRVVAFTSHATNLVAGGTNDSREVPRSGELLLTGAVGGAIATAQATGLVPNTVLILGVSLQGPASWRAPLWVQALDLFLGQLTPAIGSFVK